VLASLTPSRGARAEPDGLYGRFDGDLLAVVGAGAAVEREGPRLLTYASLTYLSTAGVYARYADALTDESTSRARSIAAGIELRPVFLARWGLDLERGPAWLDLLVDSIAIDLGAYGILGGAPREAATAREPLGPSFEAAFSIEAPLLGDADGPYVGAQAVARLPSQRLGAFAPPANLIEDGAMIGIVLTWHALFDAGLVDARRAPKER
jgi:hypothetical protein